MINTNYSEALEKQVSLLRWVEDGQSIGAEHLRNRITFALIEGDPIYVSRDIGIALGIASLGLPDTPLSADGLPSPAGFVWFESPLALPATPMMDALDPTDASSRVTGLQAISWQRGWSPFRNADRADGLFIVYWGNVLNRSLPWPGQVQHWDFGSSWTDFKHTENKFNSVRADVNAEAWNLMAANRRIFHTLLLFMQQTILVAPRHLAERHVRRRIMSEGWKRDPLVRVVQLRRREQIGGQAVAPAEREWSCQWVVRGHWRQQPYPKAGEVRPKWITPYVKGPESKPLKPPRATVFAVVR